MNSFVASDRIAVRQFCASPFFSVCKGNDIISSNELKSPHLPRYIMTRLLHACFQFCISQLLPNRKYRLRQLSHEVLQRLTLKDSTPPYPPNAFNKIIHDTIADPNPIQIHPINSHFPRSPMSDLHSVDCYSPPRAKHGFTRFSAHCIATTGYTCERCMISRAL